MAHPKMVFPFIVLVISFILAEPLVGSETLFEEVTHPVKEFMPHAEQIRMLDQTPGVSSDVIDRIMAAVSDPARDRTPGPDADVQMILFGSLTDVESDAEQNFYILDRNRDILRAFDVEGNLISTFGGQEGRGPTDFFNPTDMHTGPDGQLFVPNGLPGEIKVISRKEGSLEYEDIFQTGEIFASSSCILNDRMFTRTIAVDQQSEESGDYKLVHAFSLGEQHYTGAFGKMYESPRLGANRRISGGFAKIRCVEETDTIVYEFDAFPYLYGYSPEGELKWVTELVPFTPRETVEIVESGQTVGWRFNYHGSTIRTITPLMDGTLLVQVHQQREEQETLLHSFAVSSENGDGSYLGTDLPLILDVTDRRIISTRYEEEANIRIYALD